MGWDLFLCKYVGKYVCTYILLEIFQGLPNISILLL